MNGQQVRTVRARISNLREAADALERVLDQVEGKPKRKAGRLKVTRDTDTYIDRRDGTYDPEDPHTKREAARRKARPKAKRPPRKAGLG